MTTLPFEDPDQLSRVLQATFTGDERNIEQATNILKQMSESPQQFTVALTKIIISEKADEETLKIKNSASVNLSRFMLEAMKANKLSQEDRNFIIRSTFEAMYSDHVPLPMKVNLQFFLLLLYTVDVGNVMINEGLQIVIERLNSNNVNYYPPSFLILQAIINTVGATQEAVGQWFNALVEPLVKIGGGIVHGVILEIKGLTEGNNPTEKATNILIGLKVLKMWVLTLIEFIKVLGLNNRETGASPAHLQILVVHEPLVQVLSAILTLNITTEKQIPDCLISTCGLQEIDQILNSVKTSIIKGLSKIVDSMKDANLILNAQNNKFFLYARGYGVPLVLNSLIVFFKNEAIANLTIETVLTDRDISEHIVESLGFLTRMIQYPDVQPIYAGVIKALVVDVLFPLIKTTKKDLDQFSKEPDQFVTAALDTVSSFSSQTPKTQAAKLLEKMCINIDGALSYVVLIILCIIDYSLISDKVEDIPANYKDLAEHVNSVFITKTDPTIRVETCVLILTALSQPIGKRRDLLNMLEELFKTYQGFFLGEKSNPLIKARLCLLFAFYAHLLFKGDEKKELYAVHLRFILECVGVEGQGLEALAEHATHSLYTMFEREYLNSILDPFVPDLLGKLETYVLTTKTTKVFDIIYEIVTSYEYKLLDHPEQLISLVNTLVKRGEHEFAIIRNDKKAKKIILNKVWNIIRGIGEKEEYVIALQDDLEKALIPMFRYLETNIDLDFDEDILNYVASVTKITKKVSPTIWQIFKTFPNIFQRYEGMISNLFPALNHIIVYGYEVINSDPATIQVLIEMGIQALNSTHHNADEASFSEGALLLQLILQYLDPISNELFEKIIQATVEKLGTAEKDFLKARLGGVILCAFMKNFEITQLVLRNMNQLGDIMNLFLLNVLIFENHPYDRKLLVIALSHILVQPNISAEISSRLLKIFDIAISLLRYVGYMEQNEAKRNMAYGDDSDDDSDDEERKTSNETVLKKFLDAKEQFTAGIGDDDEEEKHNDDDSDDDEEGGSYVLGKSEANSVVRNLETSLKQRDEFAIFKDAIIRIRDSNFAALKELVDKLPPKKRDFLNYVLQSQRVETGVEGRTQARKIVKPRGKKVANVQVLDGNIVNPNNQYQQQ